MPSSCSAPGCASRLKQGCILKMHRYPMGNKLRLDAWVKTVSRLPGPGQTSSRRDGLWEPKPHDRLCSLHFVKGMPSHDPLDVDYVPTIFNHTPLSKKTPDILRQKVMRQDRVKNRDHTKIRSTAAQALLELSECSENELPGTYVQAVPEMCDAAVQTDWNSDVISQLETIHVEQTSIIKETKERNEECLSCIQILMEQTTELIKQCDSLKVRIGDLESENRELNRQLSTVLTYDQIKTNENQLFFYTGIPNLSSFLTIFKHTSKKLKRNTKKTKLDPKNEMLLTLMKLRHNTNTEDLAYRFGISKALTNRIFHKWLDALYKTLGGLVMWPEAGHKLRLPEVFDNDQFRKVRCIIDCTEIFIERPSRLKARAQTYSSYKRHNTVKVLIGVSPSGCVTFVSQVWGGRASDKKITLESGLLDKFVPGDAVMADRGFLVQDEFALRQLHLIMPSFTRGKKQLGQEEVERSRQMSRARIHVERIIGRIKDFKIIGSTMPIALVKKKGTVRKVLHVVAALFNLNNPIV